MTGPAELAGLPTAPGRAAGPVRLLATWEGRADLPPGGILVGRVLHPHLAPLLLSAAGLVLEEGAVLQHATTLARELGVPCVVGVAGATTVLADGEPIEVDGTSGLVRRAL